ncbi:flavin reductase family protein [Geobacillus sp. FJAT-46040]|uniref:flavin reductase family protein n=1 Tax=Geobacillus sp. FJAT-46040 TaxID=2011017 RepID=UPI001E2BD3BC|nr:flavin reductase family protein [Geobacillus sp. FJAT-46040]
MLAALLLMFLAACGKTATSGGEDEIKIGAIFSASGGAAPLGKPEMETVKMLVEQWNKQGGIDGKKIGHKARMHDIIKQTGKFAINILTRGQEELSRLFAGQLKEERPVSFEWVNGHPILPEALANMLCNVHSSYVAGDHTLYFGEVTDILMKDEPGAPLLFFEGKYRSVDHA